MQMGSNWPVQKTFCVKYEIFESLFVWNCKLFGMLYCLVDFYQDSSNHTNVKNCPKPVAEVIKVLQILTFILADIDLDETVCKILLLSLNFEAQLRWTM